MAYNKGDMLYDDGKHYKWKAKEDKDNPYYRGGNDHAQLNREEGYEVLYFINHVAEKWVWKNDKGEVIKPALRSYQKMEKMIRYYVPTNIRKREQIAEWMLTNWKKVPND